MKPGSQVFAAAIVEIPARRSSFTIRSCNVPKARSIRPLDCIANCTLCWAIDDQGGDYASVSGHQRTTDRCRWARDPLGQEARCYLNDSGRQQSISLAFTDLCQEDEFR